jgi:hypothetical protein
MSLLGGGVTGDIWSTGAFSFESPLKDLLDSGEFTVEDLLAQDELLQELRGVHPKLIAYFSTERAVTQLVQYLILPTADAIRPSTTTAVTVESNGSSNAGEPSAAAATIEPSAATTAATVEPAPAVTEDAPETDTSEPTTEQVIAKQQQPGEWLSQHLVDQEAATSKTQTPPSDDPELRHIRFPYMACEIICCEINGILSALADGHVVLIEQEQQHSNEEIVPSLSHDGVEVVVDAPPRRILDLLFSVLFTTPAGELDDYRAGYFDKILSVLFRRRPLEMTRYMNTGGSASRGGRTALMKAILTHLYSHSIMQIAQRLLLPLRPVPQKSQQEQEDEQNDGHGDDLLMNTLEMNDDGPTFECDWSSAPEALDMLLSMLMGVSPNDNNGDTDTVDEEHQLNLSQNASEVLITIIQHSLLSSNTMLTLTSTENISKLVTAATTVRTGDGTFFSPHESLLTSAMNVLESLILQLGGYGAVGTMSVLPEEEENDQGEPSIETSADAVATTAEPQEDVEEENMAAAADDDQENIEVEADDNNAPELADLSSIVEHLPRLLENLSYLLHHPSTAEWKSPMQFSKVKPQQLLGTSRLRIVRVLEAMVLLGDFDVDSCLIQSPCMELCLDLFWHFPWCSMLHQSVANLLVHVFEGGNARVEMQEYFIIRCNLLKRLMDSYADMQTGSSIPVVVMGLADLTIDSVAASSVESDKGSTTDPLPVSEDDVDAALEKEELDAKDEDTSAEKETPAVEGETTSVDQYSTEAVQLESRDASTIEASTVGVGAPSQSFRLGYMGHVIIICQALVHASTEEQQEGGGATEGSQASTPVEEEITETAAAGANESEGGEEEEREPLYLAEMIKYHPALGRWQDFVSTTLASETSVQSTPLGGFNAAPSSDPLHSHRPGLAEGDMMDDDGSNPPLPPRGMLGGGDAIDMDDNDLDIAASMMAGLALNRSTSGGDSDEDSGDSQKSYNSGETNSSGGYMFDDPLGKMKDGELGIELGKLTQLKGLSGKGEVKTGNNGRDDDEDDGSHSSSDEEPEIQRSNSDEGDEDADVPVMDLFAGNFSYGDQAGDSSDAPSPDWSNFANFDDAAVGGDDFGDFASAEIPFGPDSATAVLASEDSSSASELDEIFGHGDHASLLEADDPATEFEPFSPAIAASVPTENIKIEAGAASVTIEGEAVVDGQPAMATENGVTATVVEVTDQPATDDSEKESDTETKELSPTPEKETVVVEEPASD